MRNSAVTCRPAPSANSSTTARCFGAESWTGPFSNRISSGPRSATSTGPTLGGPFARFLWVRKAAEPKAPRSYTAPIPRCNQSATVEAEPEQLRLSKEAAAKQASPRAEGANE